MTITGIRSNIIKRRKGGAKWREIGFDYPGVPLGTLCRIAHDRDYQPRSHVLRDKLGLCGKRRKYDLTEREARAIGVELRSIFYQARRPRG